ncbi:MAG: glycosyltransferase [Deltaproteobacteria bacterium]|nr:glycosyltransferase [Deltaproteobacteria bacterium]NIS78270.1 glycosyltransferase [Deltaproteobacteria bacterium]
MKVLSLSSSDNEGGASIAAYRLHKGLRELGIDASMLVGTKNTDDPSVNFAFKSPKGSGKRRRRIDSLPLRMYPNRLNSLFSPSTVPESLRKKVIEYDPDIIHLHWVCDGFLRIETLREFKKPIVWTLHDMWAFTGGCHYDDECGRFRNLCGKCPLLKSQKEKDLSHRILKRKMNSWEKVNLTIVSPSRWLGECARESTLLGKREVKIIPNGIDVEKFKPVEKGVARNILNLSPTRKLILFGAMDSTSDKRKGFHYLRGALQLLQKKWGGNAELVVFGASEPMPKPELGFKSHYMGTFRDEISLAILYSASDVIITPSIQENLSNVVLEALSCGTPTIAFHIGGMPDMIMHRENGYLARPFEIKDLAEGIDWAIQNQGRLESLSGEARKRIIAGFSLPNQSKTYRALYDDILSRRTKRNL